MNKLMLALSVVLLATAPLSLLADPAYDSSEVWVSATDGNDETGNGTESNPYKTIQKGVDEVAVGGTVKIKAGMYDEGETMKAACSNRVSISKKCILEGTEGKDVTHIVGFRDFANGNANGCGDTSVRCVWIDSSNAGGTILKNLTLRDGASRYSRGTSYADYYGGGVQGTSSTSAAHDKYTSSWLIDCVVSNCSAGAGGGINGVNALRCRISNNKAGTYGSGARGAKMVNCLIDNNDMTGTSGGRACVYYCTAVNCTVVRSKASGKSSYGHGIGSSYAYNCVSFKSSGSDLNNMTDYDKTYTTATSSSLLYDYANGDFRLSPGTAAVGGGLTEYLSSVVTLPEGESAYIDYMGHEIDSESETCDAGCIQGAVREDEKTVTITAANGGIEVSGAALGENVIAVGETITITPAAGTRPCIGVSVNGVEYLFDDSPAIDVLITADFLPDTAISAIYTKHWYVDANAADDNGTGFRPGDPKKILATILPLTSSGDTVHAAAGSYTNGTMISNSTEGRRIFARASLKESVTLVADEGPDVTFIVGESDADSGSANAYGMGTNAVRCVHLGKSAVVKGFTLTGGRTWWDTTLYTASTSFGQVDSSYVGGGVCGNSTGYENSYVIDCVISNNCAYFGGAAAFTRLVRCRVFDNKATSGGGAMYKSGAYGSIFNRSRAGTPGATRSAIYQFYDIVGCTIGPDNRYIDNNSYVRALYSGMAASDFHHNLVLGAVDGSLSKTVSYCVFANGRDNYPTNETCVVAKSSDVVVDEDLRPIAGQNPAVDAGSLDVISTYAPKLLPYDVDISGAPRVRNGRVDIGALESDPKPWYAKLLDGKGRNITVTEADNTITNIANGVTLQDGMALSLTWTIGAEGAPRMGHVRVTGGGTLTVTKDGEPYATYTAEDGEVEFSFSPPGRSTVMNFAFAGEGSADVFDFSATVGTLLFIR